MIYGLVNNYLRLASIESARYFIPEHKIFLYFGGVIEILTGKNPIVEASLIIIG